MKLKFKLFLSIGPIFAVVLGALYLLVSSRETTVRQEAITNLFATTSASLQELLTRHEESVRLAISAASQDSVWSNVQASTEKEGVLQALNSLQRKIPLDLLLLVGTDGQPREGTPIGDRFDPEELKAGLQGFFQRGGELRKRTGFTVLRGKLYQLGLAPINLGGRHAALVAGMQVPFLGFLRSAEGFDLAISGVDGRWSGAATGEPADQLKLTNLGEEIERLPLSTSAYFARSIKLDPDMPALRLALLTPSASLEQGGEKLRTVFLFALLFTLIFCAAISWWISSSISQPLDMVTKAAREMSAGGSVASAPSYLTERRDEVGMVATSFNVLARSYQEELRQKEKALGKLEKYQSQLLELNHRLAKKLYENKVMLMLWREQEKAEDTKDFLSHIVEEVLQGLPFHYGCIIIRPLAQIGPEVILARIERQKTGKDEISVTDILERSDRTLWLSSLSSELKDFLLRMNFDGGPEGRLHQDSLQASIEPEGQVKKLSIVSLRLAQGKQHMGSLHLMTEQSGFSLSASDEEFLVSVAAQVSVALDNRSLQFSTRVDPLTRLYNRGYMNDRLREEMMRTSRTNRPFTLLLLDIDHFKKVNDTYGHPAGDEILVGISALLKRSCRASDAICRYGGEEIAVILADTPLTGAKAFAENLRKTIEAETYLIPEGKSIRITASMGLAEFPSQAGSMQELIKHADEALYAAKRDGRNNWRAFTA